ncbi:MAG: hypothetical protein ACRD0W_15630 [Acidimicrobiales bacterium]
MTGSSRLVAELMLSAIQAHRHLAYAPSRNQSPAKPGRDGQVGSAGDLPGQRQPGGELLEQEVTSVSGLHPGFFGDFCEVASELIG